MKQTYMLKIKDVQKQLHKAKLEESAKKLLAYIALKEEVDPKLTEQLESELAEATTAIGVVRKERSTVQELQILILWN